MNVIGEYNGTDKQGTLEWTSPEGEPMIAWGEFNICIDEHGNHYAEHDMYGEDGNLKYTVRGAYK